MNFSPLILPLKQQDELSRQIIRQRLDTILPLAMREANLDTWLLISQEDDYDPVFKTMLPLRSWAPILQMLIFNDLGEGGIERINLSMTDFGDLFARPWSGRNHPEQWEKLVEIIRRRDPQRIGVNIGSIEWAGGGLTHNLYLQLVEALPEPYAARLVSAEAASTRWLETLSPVELQYYPHVVQLTHEVIAACYSPQNVIPGVTTSDDLQWNFWQISQGLGLEQSFIPFFNVVRSAAQQKRFPLEDKVIRPGDLIHCDVGNRYLRLCSDIQEWAYVRQAGESAPPAGLRNLFTQVGRLQRVFMGEFKTGLCGDELLKAILTRARAEGIPNPKVYSHSLGYYLHEPGPLIGLPWEQESNPGRGDVYLVPDSTFTMELSIEDGVPEWGGQSVRLSCEEDVCFDGTHCQPLDRLQNDYFVI